jgi:AraC-like DNA-binding protein
MNFRIYHPAAALAPYVKHYYHLQNAQTGLINLPQHLFSLGDLYMVFLQEGEVTFQPSQHASFTLPAASVIGHFTCHHQIRVKGPVKMTVVQLNAYGCYKLSGLDMSAFNNYYRDLQKHTNASWHQLADDLAANPDPISLDALLNNAFTSMIAQNDHPLKQVDEVADYLVRHQGYINIDRLTRKFKTSRPTLERKFMEVVGITPQMYARMLRFRDAMRNMQKMNVEQWQSFITTNDYYNHAQFLQDFQFFKGETPVIDQPIIAQLRPMAVA